MGHTNVAKAEAQIILFEKRTSHSLTKKDSIYVKPDLEKNVKKYLQKFIKIDELPPNSLYFTVHKKEGFINHWAQYYPSGLKPPNPLLAEKIANSIGNHRYAEMGVGNIRYDTLVPDDDGLMFDWDYIFYDFYFFTPSNTENKPFLNWEQNNPWGVK